MGLVFLLGLVFGDEGLGKGLVGLGFAQDGVEPASEGFGGVA